MSALGVSRERPSRPMLDALAALPTSAMTEAQLERGYRGAETARSACACGVDIVVYGVDDLAAVVGAHVRSERHSAWAIAAGWR